MKINKIVKTAFGFMDRCNRDHTSAYAAQSSYFVLLSFIPFILILMSCVRFTPLTKSMVLEAVVTVCPEDLQNFVKGIVLEVYSKSLAVVPISAVLLLWTAGKGLQGLTNGLNTIYQVKDERNYLAARIRSAAYTLLFIVMIVSVLVLVVFGRTVSNVLMNYSVVLHHVIRLIILCRTAFSLLFMFLVFLLFYKFLPNRKASLKSQVPGAVLSTLSWTGFSLLFSYYLTCFGVLDMYGSLAALIMIMLWLYFCFFIFLLGAEVNAYFEEKLRRLKNQAVRQLMSLKAEEENKKRSRK